MCILSHALASLYGYYDIEDPVGSDGFARLLREKLSSGKEIPLEFSRPEVVTQLREYYQSLKS